MPENNNPPGKNNATASLVLGIIAVIFWFFRLLLHPLHHPGHCRPDPGQQGQGAGV